MRIGVDVGGTKIEAVALDDDGREAQRRRVKTPRDDYQATISSIAQLVAEVARDTPSDTPVGIATPGAISPTTGLLKNSNSTWMNGKPVDADLARAIGRRIRVANDADCFALSEAVDGAAKDAGTVFGAILGTGVGGGIVVAGELLSGPNHICGEWGHNPLPWPHSTESPGPACYCGKQGCIETFLSGPGLAADHTKQCGQRRTPEQIVEDAESGLPDAVASVARYQDRLARALALVINIIDPHVIVLGGGLSNARVLYRTVPELLARYVFSDTVATRLVQNRHGDSGGVRGAAWLWPARVSPA